MTTKRMYLKAMGSQYYDRTGVTFPGKISIDLEQIIRGVAEDYSVEWERQFEWSNQPEVLCFDVEAGGWSEAKIDEFRPFLNWLYLMPTEHWMYEMQDHQEGSRDV